MNLELHVKTQVTKAGAGSKETGAKEKEPTLMFKRTDFTEALLTMQEA